MFLNYTGASYAPATQRTLQLGQACPAGRSCGACNSVQVVLDRPGPALQAYRPLPLAAPAAGLAGPRDRSTPQNLRLWTLTANLSAGFFESRAEWRNVWWDRAAAVLHGGFGVLALPDAEMATPQLLQDAAPASLSSSYLALIPGAPYEPAQQGAGCIGGCTQRVVAQ